MEKITVIEFCPQWADETREAVKEARQIIKDGGAVELRPNTNLFSAECVEILNYNGFLYSGARGAFWRAKK
jgi:hypothetical protein